MNNYYLSKMTKEEQVKMLYPGLITVYIYILTTDSRNIKPAEYVHIFATALKQATCNCSCICY